MTKETISQLLKQNNIKAIYDIFHDAGYDINKSSLLRDALKLNEAQICGLFWCAANFLSKKDFSKDKAIYESLKTSLANVFFDDLQVRDLMFVKENLESRIREINNRHFVVEELWICMRSISNKEEEIEIAWATCLYISI